MNKENLKKNIEIIAVVIVLIVCIYALIMGVVPGLCTHTVC